MSLLDPVLDLFRGRAITVPPLDGAFRPNGRLDEAALVASLDAPDDLVRDAAGRILVASGPALLVLDPGGGTRPLAQFEAPITALAAVPDGSLLVGLDDGRLLRWRDGDDPTPLPVPGLACPTAITLLDAGTALVAQGSATRRPSEWARDLMERNSTGTVWAVELSSGKARRLAGSLAFPFGLAPAPDGRHVLVAESWRHRLVRIPVGGGRPEPVLADLPGYPARLVAAAGGGFWLALFAPRNRLIEFVLGEAGYRRAMLADIPPEHWIAPSLSPQHSFLEPLQCGAVRTMGVSKAWAPSRSYGLVVRLDAALRPVASLHSRANGRRHGVTGLLDCGHRLLVAAKGAGAVLAVAEAAR